MGQYYWWMEYFRVLLAYLVLIFVYPSILFRGYLKGKGRTFWFGFCVTASMVLVSTVVILLGLVHLLNVWVVRLLFYGSLIWSVSRSVRIPISPRYLIYKVHNGTYGGKLLAARLWETVTGAAGRCLASLWRVLRKNVVEIGVLVALMVYGLLYFSWNPIHTQGYGFSDIIVHHYWAQGLQQGKVFVAGIYPEGMHCVAYAISTLFGVELYNVLLFLQCANMIAFLGSVYLFCREITHWKGSALVMLAAFLLLKVDGIREIRVMSRLQASLPQEFGLYTVFLIPAFLMRYLKNAGQVTFRGRKTRFYWDENLVVFTLGIAASVSSHFYATIMAVFSCLGVILIWFFKVFHYRRFVPLAASALLAVTLAFGPMLLAYAGGTPFQGSIFWALNVMKPTQQETLPQADASLESQEPEDGADSPDMPAADAPAQPETAPRPSLGERASRVWNGVVSRVKGNLQNVAAYGYRVLYPEQQAGLFLWLTAAVLGLALLYRVLALLLRPLFRRWRWPAGLLDGYAIVAVITVVFMFAYAANTTDFPKLVESERVCAVEHMFLMCLITLPLDLAALPLTRLLGEKPMSALSVPAVGLAAWLIVSSGNYHGYLMLYASRYNAAVEVTASILETIPKEQFTIISTTDELYQVIDHGYHEEILVFQEKCGQQEYYLPTRYLFFYLEKRPIHFGHYHYCTMPSWLAQESYDREFMYPSLDDEMTAGAISDEAAERPLILNGKPSNAYMQLYNREIVESQMAIYLRRLEEAYPNELSVYYEDEDFVCYCLEQNPDRLFNLGQWQLP